MTPPLLVAGWLLAGFLSGSIPFGVLVARARGVDLQKVGSGNIGATNVARTVGKKLGLLVLLLDAAKGFLPLLAARAWLLPRLPAGNGEWAVAAVGVAAFLGHLAPPWLRFRGGKGVATGFGVFLALAVWPSLIAAGAFVLTYAVTRISSLGSLVAATAFLPALYLTAGRPAALAAGGAMWILIVFKHRANVGRLLRGEEGRL